MKKLEEYQVQLQSQTGDYKVKDCLEIEILDEFVIVSCYRDSPVNNSQNPNFDAILIILQRVGEVKLRGHLTPVASYVFPQFLTQKITNDTKYLKNRIRHSSTKYEDNKARILLYQSFNLQLNHVPQTSQNFALIDLDLTNRTAPTFK